MSLKKEEDVLSKRMKKIFKNEDELILSLMTTLGCAGVLTKFIMDEVEVEKLNNMVRYCCSLTCNFMIMSVTGEERIDFKNINDIEELKMNEQSDEEIYRKMKFVVEKLYEYIQEKESV